MRTKTIISSALFLVSVVSFGCGGGPNTNTAANGHANTAAKTPAADVMTNAAPTLTPVFKA